MADYNIISPKFSFVSFDPELPVLNDCCNGPQIVCLPVFKEDDIFFQFTITGADADRAQEIFDLPIESVQLLLLKGGENTFGTFVSQTMRNWTVADGFTFERYRSEEFGVTYIWKHNLKDFKAFIECDSCFQLGVKIVFPEGIETGEFSSEFSAEFGLSGNVLYGISNAFKRICDDCFTAIVEYYSKEDGNSFKYCSDIDAVNRVRLPLHFRKPQMPTEETVYKKSNGEIQLLKSIASKEYEVDTEFFPEQIHEKIVVAITSDYCYVETGAYTGGFRKNGAYTIAWDDENMCIAPANFKALVSPYAVRNTNCADCDTDDQMDLVADVFPDPLAADDVASLNVALNDKVYCSPKTYSIASINSFYVLSASITAAGVLTITMKPSLTAATGVALVTYRVTCGNGDIGETVVTGDVTGAASSCDNPDDGFLELVFSPSRKVIATFSTVSGAVAYRIVITNTVTLAFTDHLADALPATNEFVLPDGNYDFKFYSDCGSGNYSTGSDAVNITVADPPPGGGGGGGSDNYYQGTQYSCATCEEVGDVLVKSPHTLIAGKYYLDTDGLWTLINTTSPATLFDVEVPTATGYVSCPGVCI